MSRILTVERVGEIASRQFPIRFGADYIPSILATREEAPAISRPAIRYSSRLGRDFHALSVPELRAIVLAIHHPRVFDVQENYAYNHGPGTHPLASHPLGCALQLPSTQGTLAIADQFGALSLHPRARLTEDEAVAAEQDVPAAQDEAPEQGGASDWDPAFYIGDLLVYITDEQGPYVLDWDIKQRKGQHGQPGPGTLAKRHSRRAKTSATVRDVVTHAYDAELNIRQVRVAAEEIDDDVAANLFQLLGWHHCRLDRTPTESAELEQAFSASMRIGVSPISILPAWTARGWTRQDFQAVLYQAIWERRIRVDLFRPVLINRPLKPEKRDVLEVYGSWFKR